jgi:23S rRNA (cytosine1962-C5)-methyltransferase
MVASVSKLEHVVAELREAWLRREKLRLFDETEALRVFHGPGEGIGSLSNVALDSFNGHFWITVWDEIDDVAKEALIEFLREKGALSAVLMSRPQKGVPELPEKFFGSPPREAFSVKEGVARFLIRLTGSRHPGLFLDHSPLRKYLGSSSKGLRVLNTFAYTGSLSVAAGLGGAAFVCTLDLSKPSIKWAEENWRLNGLSPDQADFIAGDIFEWFPRFKKRGDVFDCIVLDPPSFARGKKGTFSTSKDLKRLHELALDVLAPAGTLITSINSADVNWKKYEGDVMAAARAKNTGLKIARKIMLPESFPVRSGRQDDGYLKGFVLSRLPSCPRAKGPRTPGACR